MSQYGWDRSRQRFDEGDEPRRWEREGYDRERDYRGRDFDDEFRSGRSQGGWNEGRGRYGRYDEPQRYGQQYGRYGEERGFGRRGFGGEQDYDERYRGDQGFESGAGRFGRGQQGYMSRPMWSYTEVWLIRGPYTGRGPRGYQRSDDRIREDVCERLTQHGQIDASDVDVRVQNGEVTLSGTVDNRQAKRMAEDTAEDVPGVKEVHNQLRVSQGQTSGTSGQQAMGTGASSQQASTTRLAPEDQPTWATSTPSSATTPTTGRREELLSRVHDGMDVIDRNEDKIGTVSKVHRTAGATAGGRQRRTATAAEPTGYLELDTGFLGLGKTLYVPMSHVTDIRDDRVVVDVAKDRVDQMGWDQRPDSIPE